MWFIPFVLFIHNVEEALTMPQWLVENLSLVWERIPFFRFVNFSATQIYVSLFVVSVIPFVVAFLCFCTPLQKKKVFVMLTLPGIIFWNALVPHVSGVLLLGMYNPGVITAGIVNIPFSVYLFHRSLKERIITAKNLRNILFLALVVYLPAVYLNHLLAEMIAGIFQEAF